MMPDPVITVTVNVPILITVLQYNGFEDDIKNLLCYLESKRDSGYVPLPPDWEKWDCNHPMRLLWSEFVLCYGDYGTSPRFGWIEDDKLEDAIKFIKEAVR